MRQIADSPPLRWPREDYTRVPYQVFTSDAVFEAEMERIFRGPTWSFVGLEVEIAKPFDFKTTWIGDTPVVIGRDGDGALRAFVNRCAHRGAMVCREARGNRKTHACVYHQWTYDATGALVGAPFYRGVGGKGGMPKDFKLANNGLEPLRIDSHCGVIFATMSDAAPALSEYLDAPMRDDIARIWNRPIQLLGFQRQRIKGNWKLYIENLRDPYHGSLLHGFHSTFGTFRAGYEAGGQIGGGGMHSLIYAREHPEKKAELSAYENVDSYKPERELEDPSILDDIPEYNDGVTISVLSVFPSMVVARVHNTIAARQIIPRRADSFDLIWTYFGYQDDDAEMTAFRLKQANLFGPSGYISMEDSEAVEIIQRAIADSGDKTSIIEMGGRRILQQDHAITENAIRSFWREYCRLMGYRPEAARA